MTHRLPIAISISIAIPIVLANPATAQTTRLDLPSAYVSGYARTLKGEELRYHSPLPYVERSLLVRSLDRDRYIADTLFVRRRYRRLRDHGGDRRPPGAASLRPVRERRARALV
jgi:hypothetical protein